MELRSQTQTSTGLAENPNKLSGDEEELKRNKNT